MFNIPILLRRYFRYYWPINSSILNFQSNKFSRKPYIGISSTIFKKSFGKIETLSKFIMNSIQSIIFPLSQSFRFHGKQANSIQIILYLVRFLHSSTQIQKIFFCQFFNNLKINSNNIWIETEKNSSNKIRNCIKRIINLFFFFFKKKVYIPIKSNHS